MFKVEEFDRERFIKLFSEQTNQKYISRKNIIKFLEKFFKRHSLSGKAPNNQILIVIEEHYLSQSYIDDIVAYHSSSFQKFEKFCKRLHFFKKGDNLPFHDQKSLEKYLKNEKHSSNEILNDRYLGYIVVKPITKAPIGAILVKPWNEQDASKSNIVKSLVDETVNFFGISISFKSLAMQPQDPSVTQHAPKHDL